MQNIVPQVENGLEIFFRDQKEGWKIAFEKDEKNHPISKEN